MQKYTSSNTSINSSKMPKIYKFVSPLINENETVIDYGCGKFFDKYEIWFNCVGYDPYNMPNEDALHNHYDVALCSNVLNVISEKENRLDVLKKLKSLANTVYISVYEGDKTGVGKETKKDCYQLNKLTGWYIPEIVSVFGAGNVVLERKGYFKCRSIEEVS